MSVIQVPLIIIKNFASCQLLLYNLKRLISEVHVLILFSACFFITHIASGSVLQEFEGD